jgi:hypothetical protein
MLKSIINWLNGSIGSKNSPVYKQSCPWCNYETTSPSWGMYDGGQCDRCGEYWFEHPDKIEDPIIEEKWEQQYVDCLTCGEEVEIEAYYCGWCGTDRKCPSGLYITKDF